MAGSKLHAWEFPLILIPPVWIMVGIASIYFLSSILAGWFYPMQSFEPDLAAYFVFFREFMSGGDSLHGLGYFNHPKALLVFLLGPLGNHLAAIFLSAAFCGLLGVVVYQIGLRCFGVEGALLWVGILLFDPGRIFYTLQSGADFYVAVFLFSAISLCLTGRWASAGFVVFLACLVKPVAVPCALQFLLAPVSRARRLALLTLPALAVGVTLAVHKIFLGSWLAPGNFLAEFARLRQVPGTPFWELPHFVFWEFLVRNRLGWTALFGCVGFCVWIWRDRARLCHPLFLMPVLLFLGYVLLAASNPFMPFFRFFWPIEVWFAGYSAYGIYCLAKIVARKFPSAFPALLFLGLVALATQSLLIWNKYHVSIARPMETERRFFLKAADVLKTGMADGDTVVAPLASLPILMFHSGSQNPGRSILAQESVGASDFDWLVWAPRSYLTGPAAGAARKILDSGGYELICLDSNSGVWRKNHRE